MKALPQSARIVSAVLLCTLVTLAQANQRAKTEVRLEQVSLQTQDGVQLNGIVYQPTTSKARPVGLMLVHGFAANFYEAYFPYLGRAAARRNFIVLALNMRDHDAGPKTSDFADNRTDIAAGVEYLHGLGAKKIVLLGQSMGTNRVLYYQAATNDPSVAATVLVSGPGNLFGWNVWQFGQKKAEETVNEALRKQMEGRGRDLMLIEMGPLGKALYTPQYLLSMRGPTAKSDPYQNIQSVNNPILILQGKADQLIESDIAVRLRQAAAKNSRVEVQYVEAAGHSFSREHPALVERILSWIESLIPQAN